MALVPDEENDPIAYGPDQELAVAALSGVPDIAAPKRRKKSEGLRTFTEEDFEEGVERICFNIVRANVECLFDRKRKPEDYIKAAHWVFGRTLGDFTFERCCITLGTRKDVLRLRIHYEFWRRWYVFPIEFPFMIDPVPESVEGEIYMLAGDEGYALARAAWMHPGIRSGQLLEVAAAAVEAKGNKRPTEERMRDALKLVSEKYLMSQYNDSWYLTGRNPVLRAMDLSSAPNRVSRNQMNWSRMF